MRLSLNAFNIFQVLLLQPSSVFILKLLKFRKETCQTEQIRIERKAESHPAQVDTAAALAEERARAALVQRSTIEVIGRLQDGKSSVGTCPTVEPSASLRVDFLLETTKISTDLKAFLLFMAI